MVLKHLGSSLYIFSILLSKIRRFIDYVSLFADIKNVTTITLKEAVLQFNTTFFIVLEEWKFKCLYSKIKNSSNEVNRPRTPIDSRYRTRSFLIDHEEVESNNSLIGKEDVSQERSIVLRWIENVESSVAFVVQPPRARFRRFW
ncbi:unnamed protein product [Xylocopa violacea]|uniref:Uncharacterized protein n=1 Tax=Xylocopa violacea TaxID=135666 RepID=A0ABP1N5S7_XYLVO